MAWFPARSRAPEKTPQARARSIREGPRVEGGGGLPRRWASGQDTAATGVASLVVGILQRIHDPTPTGAGVGELPGAQVHPHVGDPRSRIRDAEEDEVAGAQLFATGHGRPEAVHLPRGARQLKTVRLAEYCPGHG